jgi:hypothetical protein
MDMDNYYDGYKSSELNCIDLPIGAAAGFYHRDNYFYYCFAYCLFMNFFLNYQADWLESRNRILDSLGLCLDAVSVQEANLLDQIKKCLDEEKPVIMIVKYGSLFYSRYYGWGTFNHALLLSDYNDTYELIGVRDREAVKEHIENGHFSSDIMHRITLKYEHIHTIWKESERQFAVEQLPYQGRIFCIRKSKEASLGLEEILRNAWKQEPVKNMLWEYAKSRAENPEAYTDQETEAMRRSYYRSFLPFFELLEKKLPWKEDGRKEYVAVKEMFLKERMHAINGIQLELMRGQKGSRALEALCSRDMECTGKLLDFLHRLSE